MTQLLNCDECQKHLADGWPAVSVGEMILTAIAHQFNSVNYRLKIFLNVALKIPRDLSLKTYSYVS